VCTFAPGSLQEFRVVHESRFPPRVRYIVHRMSILHHMSQDPEARSVSGLCPYCTVCPRILRLALCPKSKVGEKEPGSRHTTVLCFEDGHNKFSRPAPLPRCLSAGPACGSADRRQIVKHVSDVGVLKWEMCRGATRYHLERVSLPSPDWVEYLGKVRWAAVSFVQVGTVTATLC
jgi:hypothetical protein